MVATLETRSIALTFNGIITLCFSSRLPEAKKQAWPVQ